jgi:drug/metabolite transporter (DMT)-like permease
MGSWTDTGILRRLLVESHVGVVLNQLFVCLFSIIVFRALSPCVVAFLDAIFLGREYPNKRSWLALALIVVGAYCYASFDLKFQTQGMMAYGWPTAYLFIISLEMAYGKRIIRSVDLQTLSGPVLYTNLLGLPPMFMFAVMGHETNRLTTTDSFPTAGLWILLLGCIAGTGIGYSGWWCRDKVSATSFTLIGVINKCLTILLNLVVWDQHAPMGGILSLLICLVGGTLYQQAPMREDSATSEGKKLDGSGIEVANREHESLLETEYESSSEKEADV